MFDKKIPGFLPLLLSLLIILHQL